MTGKLTGTGSTSLKFAETIIAGTDGLIADGRLHTYSLGTRLAAAGEYTATGDHIVKMHRKQFAEANSKRAKIASELRDLSRKLRS